MSRHAKVIEELVAITFPYALMHMTLGQLLQLLGQLTLFLGLGFLVWCQSDDCFSPGGVLEIGQIGNRFNTQVFERLVSFRSQTLQCGNRQFQDLLQRFGLVLLVQTIVEIHSRVWHALAFGTGQNFNRLGDLVVFVIY